MELNKQQLLIILEIFEEYNDMLSELSRGNMMTEEWELYELLKSNL